MSSSSLFYSHRVCGYLWIVKDIRTYAVRFAFSIGGQIHTKKVRGGEERRTHARTYSHSCLHSHRHTHSHTRTPMHKHMDTYTHARARTPTKLRKRKKKKKQRLTYLSRWVQATSLRNGSRWAIFFSLVSLHLSSSSSPHPFPFPIMLRSRFSLRLHQQCLRAIIYLRERKVLCNGSQASFFLSSSSLSFAFSSLF